MNTLAEDLLLLALDDDKGTVSWQRSDATIKFGLGGALLTDLALQERIDIYDKKIFVSDSSPTGDEILDSALETIQSSNKPRDAKHWVKKLGDRKDLKEHLARRLVARGILREQEHSFLWVFDSPRFPTSDPGPEASIRGQVRDVALAGVEPDARTLRLLSLISACDLTGSLFSRAERKQATRRIEELVEGEQFGKAVDNAIAEAIAAITVIAATSSTSS